MNRVLRQLLPFVGPAVALGTVTVSWLLSSLLTIPRAFLLDVALIGLAAGVMLLGKPWVLGATVAIRLPWMACGALLGAAILGPISLAPWVAFAALAVSLAGALRWLATELSILRRLGLVATGAALNGAVLWAVLFGGHRPLSPAVFEAQPLRVHTLLKDVPLHDVWAIRLRNGGADLTMEEVGARLRDGLTQPPNAALAWLVGARGLLGWVFSWDDQECADPAASYVHRLSEDDRARSVHDPTANGFLYTHDGEALAEIANCTVHAFLAMALEPADYGHRLTVGVYVKQSQEITPFYMALIDPFRRFVVYPVVIEHIERYWERVVGTGSPCP